MPKLIELHNQAIGVERGTELDNKLSQENGSPMVVDTWTIVFQDRSYGDQIRITVRKDARDALVRDLTGGIVLAGGELPQKPAPE